MGFHTLNIGASGLLSNQTALNTVGHNVANAATPGYTRQRALTEARDPSLKSFGAVGSGVGIRTIRRIADEFLERQVREANSLHSYYDAQIQTYESIEALFNELSENDISTELDKFWNALSDVNNHVEDVSTRRAMVNQAEVLANAFQAMDSKLYDMRVRLNNNVVRLVDDINSLLAEIAQLNHDIVRTEQAGSGPVVANDTRDQRTERLKELAGYLDITVVEEPNGAAVVSLKGRLLVFEDQYFELTTERQSSDDALVDVAVFERDLDEVEAGRGLLGAYQNLRDEVILSYKQDMDRLAGQLLWEFNRIHTQGQGLQGYTRATSANAVTNPTAALDEIGYDFDPLSETYTIQNGNFEIHVRNEVTGEVTPINIEIDLDDTGEADTILYDDTAPPPTQNNALVNKIQNALEERFENVFNVTVDTSNRVTIESQSENYTFGFGRDTSGVLAALGFNNLFNGYDAGSIGVEGAIVDGPQLVAGSRTFEPGDNANAVALLQLRQAPVYENRTATVDDFYQGIVGRLGIEFSQKESLLETQTDILKRAENQREDLSGVNLDEELTRMIQFQRSFQSAARFISTADILYETLIGM